MKALVLLSAFVALAACAASETSRRASPEMDLPPMKTFSAVSPSPPRLPNSVIARDFLDLVFELENGDRVPVFSRFEGPITVEVKGTPPPTLVPDLDRLLARLRREAQIPITRTGETGTGSIVIEPVSKAQIRKVAPSAACFVRPNVSGWQEYRARLRDRETYWNRLTRRTRMTVFLPRDVSPQEIRDCLHEEIAQALGPVNDLYRLSQSDLQRRQFSHGADGVRHVDPARLLRGQSCKPVCPEAQVAARLPDILLRLNPSGGRQGIAPPVPPRKAWVGTINEATALRASKSRRRAAADKSVSLAQRAGLTDIRLGLSYYLQGRASLTSDPDKALGAFIARRAHLSKPPRHPHSRGPCGPADRRVSTGSGTLGCGHCAGRWPQLDVVRKAEHAALLSLLLMVKAEALQLQGRTGDADKVQRDALAWARYGFGDEAKIRETRGGNPGHFATLTRRRCGMIVPLGLIFGVIYGLIIARRRKGNRLDMAQYAAGYGIAFALLAVFAALAIEHLAS